ncbi:hypothetical protein C1Y25_26585 [Pseudomonas sp. MPBC4-3]|nr:hypothetical protein C1Y25_26585 [Pseudomonas sp. MPBC4-3]PMX43237.1 hypothetical protein C1Y20_27610 [Pseudomonas sp. FW301-21B01]
MLAKNSQTPRSFRKHALSLTFFVSKLAPTEGDVRLTERHLGKPARHREIGRGGSTSRCRPHPTSAAP